MSLRVYGGMTNAGNKKALQPPRGAWTCSHGHENKGAWTRCLTAGCNEKRDT